MQRAFSKQLRSATNMAAVEKNKSIADRVVDNYALPDTKFENILRSRFWMNRMRNCYSISPYIM